MITVTNAVCSPRMVPIAHVTHSRHHPSPISPIPRHHPSPTSPIPRHHPSPTSPIPRHHPSPTSPIPVIIHCPCLNRITSQKGNQTDILCQKEKTIWFFLILFFGFNYTDKLSCFGGVPQFCCRSSLFVIIVWCSKTPGLLLG